MENTIVAHYILFVQLFIFRIQAKKYIPCCAKVAIIVVEETIVQQK